MMHTPDGQPATLISGRLIDHTGQDVPMRRVRVKKDLVNLFGGGIAAGSVYRVSREFKAMTADGEKDMVSLTDETGKAAWTAVRAEHVEDV